MRSFGIKQLVMIGFLAMMVSNASARTWYIKADGTGDAPTIQAGVDSSASSDSVLLADGTFVGVGNREIQINKNIFVGSQTGDPYKCVIDCENESGGFYITSLVAIRGVTITNGVTPSAGGAIHCDYAGLTLADCLIVSNSAGEGGGLSSFDSQYLNVTGCTFDGNSASFFGGAMYSKDRQSVVIERCIVTDNSAPDAGTILVAIPSAVSVECSNIFGNQGGDWVGGIEPHAGVDGNLSVDPEYCGIDDSGNYFLQSDSPCAPGNHPDMYECALIGALPINCGEVAAKKSTWGSMKARFRK